MAHEATAVRRDGPGTLRDEEVVSRVLEGDIALFEVLMRRYNQRLYRAARAIVRDDGEAEDVMQDGARRTAGVSSGRALHGLKPAPPLARRADRP